MSAAAVQATTIPAVCGAPLERDIIAIVGADSLQSQVLKGSPRFGPSYKDVGFRPLFESRGSCAAFYFPSQFSP